MNSFSRSLLLVKESFRVLRKDKELLLFPICSGIAGLVAIVSFWVPLGYLYINHQLRFLEGSNGTFNLYFYLALFIFYLVTYFIITFFSSGLIWCAHKRLSGGDPTFREGIKAAVQNIWKIFMWSLISATIGILLKILSEKAGLIGRIIATVINIAWDIVTFLIIPILLFEDKGVSDSIKESETLFKKTWGEQIIGNFSFGIFFGLLLAVTLILIVGIMIYISFQTRTSHTSNLLESLPLIQIFLIMGCIVFYMLVLSIFHSTLDGIFMAALYIYAKTNTVPSAFTSEVIQRAFKNKKESEDITQVENNKTT